jgi:cellulose synthase/poly-beta-1,6-N-acetylglucosamine synthase-like glycosyltransferase
MATFVSIGLISIAGLLCIPALTLLVEVIAAQRPSREKPLVQTGGKRRVAVIVPAHNESSGIIPTIGDILPQLGQNDRLIVVADNCSDDTAEVAERAGAKVIVRNDVQRIGKGYALGWAIDHIKDDPPDFVVFVDADCRVQSDAIARLSEVCDSLQRPVQACFVMHAPENSPINHGLAEFAFLLRNLVRPLGLKNLNLPVQLMGTGMIFPWDLIRGAPLASGHLVEDLKLGLDLAELAKAPYFYPAVKVTSEFPVTAKGTDSQRQRWVQGHLGMILKSVPRLLLRSIARRNLDLLALTLDLLIPPLSLLGLLVVGIFVVTSIAALFGLSAASLWIASVNIVLFAAAVLLAWAKFGHVVLPGRFFLSIGPLIFQRIRLYGGLLMGRTASHWVRTARGDR